MRGIAALAVATYHFDPGLMPHGYLAVDFFFVLSGFVLMHSYAQRLASGMLTRDFALIRLVRLYPTYILGILIGLFFAVQGLQRDSLGHLSGLQIAVSTPFNALMLPSPASNAMYPINPPAWSLFYEMIANLCLVGFLARMPIKWLRIAIALCAATLVIVLVAYQHFDWLGSADSDYATAFSAGSDWVGVPAGLLRTALSFSLGVYIAEVFAQRHHVPRVIAVLILIAPVLLLHGPRGIESDLGYDLVVILGASPLLIWLGAQVEPPQALRGTCETLGVVSYALYAIHLPFAHAAQNAGRFLGMPSWLMAMLYLAGVLLLAWLAVRWIDQPARGWLKRVVAINGRPTTPA